MAGWPCWLGFARPNNGSPRFFSVGSATGTRRMREGLRGLFEPARAGCGGWRAPKARPAGARPKINSLPHL